ncbi:sporulation YhaL family protein [Virgibacillus halophilus]|uniref:Sporulation YhaL family protein n=1 Tax=Tigheibacillus halophilus TaxID=361280 RepID=A0ABU5CAX6_9BACI|nr:sporulation YhaL family protein [Virgibacillus halophilus]
MILGMPWWIFLIVLLIFLSGYMAFRAMRAEKQLEQQFIEKEGNIYLQRMEDERQRKAEDHRGISS